MLPLLDTVKAVELTSKYEVYKHYPITYYVNFDVPTNPTISDVPGRNYIKVHAYVIRIEPTKGLVIHTFQDNAVLVPFEIVNNTIVEASERTLMKILNKLVDFINGKQFMSFTHHELEGISKLMLIPYDEIMSIIKIYELEKELEDKLVAVFPDFVIVFSRKRFMLRYDGKEAVDVAKRVAFPVEGPVRYIAKYISKVSKSKELTAFVLSDKSILCNTRICIVAPLPSNIFYLVVSHTDINWIVIDLERSNETDYMNTKLVLPEFVDAVLLSRRGFFMMRQRNELYEIMRRLPFTIPKSIPLIFTRSGFAGYGKFIVKGTRVLVKNLGLIKYVQKGEREEEYLEKIILGS